MSLRAFYGFLLSYSPCHKYRPRLASRRVSLPLASFQSRFSIFFFDLPSPVRRTVSPGERTTPLRHLLLPPFSIPTHLCPVLPGAPITPPSYSASLPRMTLATPRVSRRRSLRASTLRSSRGERRGPRIAHRTWVCVRAIVAANESFRPRVAHERWRRPAGCSARCEAGEVDGCAGFYGTRHSGGEWGVEVCTAARWRGGVKSDAAAGVCGGV